MDKSSNGKDNSILSLSNIGELTSFTIAVTVCYSIISVYVYYNILLHVPVFQYLEFSEIVFMSPSGIFLALYVGTLEVSKYVARNDYFDKYQKIVYRIILGSFILFLIWLVYKNDPVIEQFILLPLKYILYGIIPFVAYIAITMHSEKIGRNIFKRHRYIAVFVITIWYAIFEPFANYAVLTQDTSHSHYIIRMKNGNTFITTDNTIYAGRTKNYWFIYYKKQHIVRSIKNENVEIVDFDIYNYKSVGSPK